MTSRGGRAAVISNWPPAELQDLKSQLPPHLYGLVYAVYADILLAQSWTDVTLHPLNTPSCSPLISGTQLTKTPERRYVYPMSSEQNTSIKALHDLFNAADAAIGCNKVGKILLGIVHTDSTVVYYTLNKGIIKPTVN